MIDSVSIERKKLELQYKSMLHAKFQCHQTSGSGEDL